MLITPSRQALLDRCQKIANTLWPTEWEHEIRSLFDDTQLHAGWVNAIDEDFDAVAKLLQILLQTPATEKDDVVSLAAYAYQPEASPSGVPPIYLLIAHYLLCRQRFADLIPVHWIAPPMADDDLLVMSYLCRVFVPVIGLQPPKDWGYWALPPSTPRNPEVNEWN